MSQFALKFVKKTNKKIKKTNKKTKTKSKLKQCVMRHSQAGF